MYLTSHKIELRFVFIGALVFGLAVVAYFLSFFLFSSERYFTERFGFQLPQLRKNPWPKG